VHDGDHPHRSLQKYEDVGKTPADVEQRTEKQKNVALIAVPIGIVVLGLIAWERWIIVVLAAIGLAGAGFALFFRKSG